MGNTIKQFILYNLYYIIIIAVILVFLVFGFFSVTKTIKENKLLKQLTKQNELSQDSIKRVNENTYKKFAEINELNKGLQDLVLKKDEVILSENKLIIKLKDLISAGKTDTLIAYDTVKVNNCEGLRLSFSGENIFRDYLLNVEIKNPPYHTLKETFKPFSLTTYITRDKKGFYSGYAKVEEKFSQYINISDMKVVLDKDEYVSIEKPRQEKLHFLVSAGTAIENKLSLSVGCGFYYSNNLVMYKKGINNNFHFITYGYAIF